MCKSWQVKVKTYTQTSNYLITSSEPQTLSNACSRLSWMLWDIFSPCRPTNVVTYRKSLNQLTHSRSSGERPSHYSSVWPVPIHVSSDKGFKLTFHWLTLYTALTNHAGNVINARVHYCVSDREHHVTFKLTLTVYKCCYRKINKSSVLCEVFYSSYTIVIY